MVFRSIFFNSNQFHNIFTADWAVFGLCSYYVCALSAKAQMVAGLDHRGRLLGEANNALLPLFPASVEVFDSKHLSVFPERFDHNFPQLGTLNVA